MNITPLKNKVALKEYVIESKSTTGIILVGSDLGETPIFGVVAIGPQVTDFKIGDRVMIEMGKGTIIEDMLIIEDKFITTIVE